MPELLSELLGGEATNPENERYLDFLTTSPLDRLSREPENLANEVGRIEAEMQSSVVQDYRSFIQASQCIHTLHASISDLSQSLQSLTTSLQPLPQACDAFTSHAASLQQEREKNQLTARKYDRIVELLKIPQWMEKRVRQSQYEEALQYLHFAQQLAKKHQDTAVIQSIRGDVERQAERMRDQLHQNLRGNIKVHQCLENISFLRRLEVYSDSELRVIFLKSRNAWFHSQWERLSTKNAYSYLSKLIDYTRDHLYEVITQYRVIFADSVTHEPAEGVQNDATVLSSWVIHQVGQFLEELRRHLPRIQEGSSIRNLMDLAISISRVGVDVSGFLPPIFEEHVHHMFSQVLVSGRKHFEESIQTDALTSAAKARNPLTMERKDTLAPSRALLELPPLAVLTNKFLQGLNELRQCAILRIRSQLAQVLYEEMGRVVEAIVAQKSAARSVERQSELARLAQGTAEHFVPFMERCFHSLFQTTLPLFDSSPLLVRLESLYEKRPASTPSLPSSPARPAPPSPSPESPEESSESGV